MKAPGEEKQVYHDDKPGFLLDVSRDGKWGLYERYPSRSENYIIAIDPNARSSMCDDLDAKRPTEIDYIQGEIVALADRLGMQAPVNARPQVSSRQGM